MLDKILPTATTTTTHIDSRTTSIVFSVISEEDVVNVLRLFHEARLIFAPSENITPVASSSFPDKATEAHFAFTIKAFQLLQDIKKRLFFSTSDPSTTELFYVDAVDCSKEQLSQLLRQMFANSQWTLTELHGRMAPYPLDLQQSTAARPAETQESYFSPRIPSPVTGGSTPGITPGVGASTRLETASTPTPVTPASVLPSTPSHVVPVTPGFLSLVASGKRIYTGKDCVDWILTFTSCLNRQDAHHIAINLARTGFLQTVRRAAASTALSFDSMDDQYLLVTLSNSGKKASGLNTSYESLASSGGNSKSSKQEQLFALESFKLKKPRSNSNSTSVHKVPSPNGSSSTSLGSQSRKAAIPRRLADNSGSTIPDAIKDSPAARLKEVLEDSALLQLFGDFMRKQYCEENLTFWLDAKKFRDRFESVDVSKDAEVSKRSVVGCQPFISLIPFQQAQAMKEEITRIFEEYLSPTAPAELNIDSHLRKKMQVRYEMALKYDQGESNNESNASTILRGDFFEVLQKYVHNMMATESILKFMKWDEYIRFENTQEEASKPPPTDQPDPLIKQGGIFASFRKAMMKIGGGKQQDRPSSVGANKALAKTSIQEHEPAIISSKRIANR